MKGGLFMFKIAIIVFVVSLFLVDYVFSDVRIYGLGNGLVFPDGSKQSSAPVPAPVHGTIGGLTGGTTQSGNGFTSTRTDTGSYFIDFDPHLTSTPDCFISSQGNTQNGNGYAACEPVTLSNSSINVTCWQYSNSQYSPVKINSDFTFICVQ
jgi:hypothetical protein